MEGLRVLLFSPRSEVTGFMCFPFHSLQIGVCCLHLTRFWDVFESILSSGRGSLLIVFVSLRQKYQQYYRTHKILVVLLHFSYYSPGLYSVQILFEEPMDISIVRKLCSYVQRRQAVVELQQYQPGAGIWYLSWWQRAQCTKVMVWGRRDTRQPHEERGTESVRRNINEKEQNGGRGELWRQSQTNVENIEITLRDTGKSARAQT